MNTATPALCKLARQLFALEAARTASADQCGPAAQCCDKLRVPLARLAGVAGFRSLLTRALALARAEKPGLDGVAVRPDGTLEGLDAALRASGAGAAEAGAAIVAQLLGLLVTFIGEPLTRQLVREAWPDAAVELDQRAGGQP